jgi:hypothetical protein
MRSNTLCTASLLLLGLLSPAGYSQEKSKADEKPKVDMQTTPVKVTIVFTEYEGDKKVKNLPYTLYINAAEAQELRPGWSKLRIGSRVPVYTGKDQLSYLDVGTNIDARASHAADGRFLLALVLERSWVGSETPVPVTKTEASQTEAAVGHFREPVVQQFKSELEVKIREGQTVESVLATDPLSGKVLKVEVSITSVK